MILSTGYFIALGGTELAWKKDGMQEMATPMDLWLASDQVSGGGDCIDVVSGSLWVHGARLWRLPKP